MRLVMGRRLRTRSEVPERKLPKGDNSNNRTRQNHFKKSESAQRCLGTKTRAMEGDQTEKGNPRWRAEKGKGKNDLTPRRAGPGDFQQWGEDVEGGERRHWGVGHKHLQGRNPARHLIDVPVKRCVQIWNRGKASPIGGSTGKQKNHEEFSLLWKEVEVKVLNYRPRGTKPVWGSIAKKLSAVREGGRELRDHCPKGEKEGPKKRKRVSGTYERREAASNQDPGSTPDQV